MTRAGAGEMVQQGRTFAVCGGLSIIGPHNLIGRCGFVGMGMALLEEVRHCGGGP